MCAGTSPPARRVLRGGDGAEKRVPAGADARYMSISDVGGTTPSLEGPSPADIDHCISFLHSQVPYEGCTLSRAPIILNGIADAAQGGNSCCLHTPGTHRGPCCFFYTAVMCGGVLRTRTKLIATPKWTFLFWGSCMSRRWYLRIFV